MGQLAIASIATCQKKMAKRTCHPKWLTHHASASTFTSPSKIMSDVAVRSQPSEKNAPALIGRALRYRTVTCEAL